jgi:glycosyltransferase involved in cell wall biosynthesis
MSENFDSMKIVVTHAQIDKVKEGVDYFVLGGGNIFGRIKALSRLVILIPYILSNRKSLVVFHHMTVYPLYLLGPLIWFLRIPQGLWYSHGKKAPGLIWGHFFCNHIFSPTTHTFPIRSKKLTALGHGIELSGVKTGIVEDRKLNVLAVGRITPAKRIEELVFALSNLPKQFRNIILIGQIQSDNYYQFLLNLARGLQVELQYCPSMNRSQLQQEYRRSMALFSGTRKSVDKVTLEAALYGCLVVTRNPDVHDLLNTDKCFSHKKVHNYSQLSVEGQLKIVFSKSKINEIRKCLEAQTRQNCSLKMLCSKMAIELQSPSL